jgi:hypothetical protein
MARPSKRIRQSTFWTDIPDPYSDEEEQLSSWHFRTREGRRKLKVQQRQEVSQLADTTTPTTTMEDSSSDNNNASLMGRMIPGLSRQVFGFPKSIVTKMRYCTNITLTSTTGAVTYNTFRANSVFDPDQSGVGHQPMWRDNYAAVYSNYRVLGSKIKTIFTPLIDAADANRGSYEGPWIVGINGTNSTASYSSTPETRMEANDSVYKLLNARTGADGVVVLHETYSAETTLGRPTTDDTTGSTVGSSPSAEWYWQVWTYDYSGATSEVVAVCEIEYTVEFFNLTNQAQN